MSSELTDILITRRKALNITQEALSLSSGVALRTLKELERSKGNPTLATLDQLAKALGLNVTLTVQTPPSLIPSTGSPQAEDSRRSQVQSAFPEKTLNPV